MVKVQRLSKNTLTSELSRVQIEKFGSSGVDYFANKEYSSLIDKNQQDIVQTANS